MVLSRFSILFYFFSIQRNEDEENLKEESKKNENSSKETDEDNSIHKDDINLKFLDMYSSIYSMRQDLERVKKPIGTRDNPARTCKDLYYGHSSFDNGKTEIQI